METRKFEQMKEKGRQCRRNGGKRSDNPYGRSPSLRAEATAWEAGFNEEDQRKAEVKR